MGLFSWLKVRKKINKVGSCDYCGEWTIIKTYYGGCGGEYGYLLGSACCHKCDDAKNIQLDKKLKEALIEAKKGIPDKEQVKWRKERDKILK